jgi:hypothetical protein
MICELTLVPAIEEEFGQNLLYPICNCNPPSPLLSHGCWKPLLRLLEDKKSKNVKSKLSIWIFLEENLFEKNFFLIF